MCTDALAPGRTGVTVLCLSSGQRSLAVCKRRNLNTSTQAPKVSQFPRGVPAPEKVRFSHSPTASPKPRRGPVRPSPSAKPPPSESPGRAPMRVRSPEARRRDSEPGGACSSTAARTEHRPAGREERAEARAERSVSSSSRAQQSGEAACSDEPLRYWSHSATTPASFSEEQRPRAAGPSASATSRSTCTAYKRTSGSAVVARPKSVSCSASSLKMGSPGV
mmetsp:Transcript_31295/g.100101  ORF Transcript_31295/g.100101 Transcript_31295/m.100101 type:complete len:221 (+) Transcript_31295:47-709(+)